MRPCRSANPGSSPISYSVEDSFIRVLKEDSSVETFWSAFDAQILSNLLSSFLRLPFLEREDGTRGGGESERIRCLHEGRDFYRCRTFPFSFSPLSTMTFCCWYHMIQVIRQSCLFSPQSLSLEGDKPTKKWRITSEKKKETRNKIIGLKNPMKIHNLENEKTRPS
ncbi:hypothetical protein [Phaffia rhodozyma]|uniref:Uncharacterized protein n=1 Tax=Phaffia rhodozyma TaxID=264483 RepID=A0A0F7SPM4_PHARH|nr:hypothetical protein [Phaffia rhodozyma]